MRIRRNAARLLRSACSVRVASPPDMAAQSELLMPPPAAFCSALGSGAAGDLTSPTTASEHACESNRNPWDLLDKLSISDPQVEDELVDKYFVSVPCRASWLTATMPVSSTKKEKQWMVHRDSTTKPQQQVQKKMPKKLAVSKDKGNEPQKTAKVKKDDQEIKQQSYKCKKNDGRQWQCDRAVSRPNSLCDYHFNRKRAHMSSEFAAMVAAKAEAETGAEARMKVLQQVLASKPGTTSKPQKKKPRHDFGATGCFYYYAGIGPFRSKTNHRSNMNEYVPLKKEEVELAEDGSPNEGKAQAAVDDTIQHATGCDDKSSGDAGIAGVDEGSKDDHFKLGSCDRSMNMFRNFDGKMNKGCTKQWRKPVKKRSLRSLT